jgi:O-antigen/teichoic acid export membrane protein
VVIVWTAINNSFMPTLFENLKDGTNVYFKVREVINPLVLLYGVFAMVMALIAPEVINLLTTDEYMSAINIIPPVVAGVFLTCIYTLFSNVLVYYKKTKYIMLGTLLASGINIVLNYILIPQYGYVVAAYTTLVSYIVLAISQYVAMKHVVKMEIYDVKYFMVLSLSVIVSCLLCNLIYGLLIFRYLLILFIGIGILVWIKKKGKI